MELIYSLLKLLNEKQLKELAELCGQNERAEYKLLLLYIIGEKIEAKTTAKKLKLTPASFNKTQTLAKDALVNFVKIDMQSFTDKIVIVQRLLMIGENKSAQKLYTALEKEYELKQAWNMLEQLYIEGFRIAQISGDIALIEDVAERRSKNIERLMRNVQCYGKVMVEMLSVERFEERKEDPHKYLQRAEQLYHEAMLTGHHVVIHNALNTLYMIYARYFNEPEKTWQIIQKITENREQYKEAMNTMTAAVSKISKANFLSIHTGFDDPEKNFADCEATIEVGGVLAKVNFYYALLGYYLCEEKIPQVNKYLGLLEQLEDTTKFKQYKAIVLAVKSFIDEDFAAFHKYYQEFYADPTHIDFPDMEFVLRILELVLLYKEKETLVFDSRLQALRVYMNRNLNKTRYAEEYQIVNCLASHDPKKSLKPLEELNQKSYYRNIRLLSKLILKHYK